VSSRNRFPIIMLWTIAVTLILAGNAMAYIGPGAGMEFFGYAMSLIVMIGLAFFSILMWPFYAFMRWLRGNKQPSTTDPSIATPSNSNDSPTAPTLAPSDNSSTAPSSS
jgi:hypothetical protein